jgi:hypothetical protein
MFFKGEGGGFPPPSPKKTKKFSLFDKTIENDGREGAFLGLQARSYVPSFRFCICHNSKAGLKRNTT